MDTQNIKAMYIIVNAGFSEEAMEIARECGAGGGTIINARGTGAHLASIFGAHVMPEKEIIISIVSAEVADMAMEKIKEALGGAKGKAGAFCFCTPVDAIAMTQSNKTVEE